MYREKQTSICRLEESDKERFSCLKREKKGSNIYIFIHAKIEDLLQRANGLGGDAKVAHRGHVPDHLLDDAHERRLGDEQPCGLLEPANLLQR